MIEALLMICLNICEPRVVESFEEHLANPPQPVVQKVDHVYRGMGTNVERWRHLVEAYVPAERVETMMCLMKHESGGNPNAKNPRSSARGLFQILASLWAPHFGVSYQALYDPETNVRLAARILELQGYGAWSPWNRGLCR